MQELNAAWAVLSDPVQREEYDRAGGAARRRMPSTADGRPPVDDADRSSPPGVPWLARALPLALLLARARRDLRVHGLCRTRARRRRRPVNRSRAAPVRTWATACRSPAGTWSRWWRAARRNEGEVQHVVDRTEACPPGERRIDGRDGSSAMCVTAADRSAGARGGAVASPPWRPTSTGAGPVGRRSRSDGRWPSGRPATCPDGHSDTTRLLSVFAAPRPGRAAGSQPGSRRAAGVAAAGPAAAVDLMAQGSFDRARALEQLGAEHVRRPRHRRRHHRRRRGPRRRQPRPAHRARRARRLRQRHVVEDLEARPRRPALPAERRRPPRLRGAARAPAAAAQRPAPRAAAARSSSRSSRRTGSSTRRSPGRSGSAMWMYDLTGGARIGKLHKRLKKAQAVGPHADAARGAAGRRATSTTTPPPTTPASRSRSPAPPRSTTAPWSPTTPRSSSCCTTTAAGPPAPSVEADGRTHRGARPRGGQRHRRVGRRRARARRGRRTPTASGRPRASTSRCRGTKVRNDIAVVVPVPKDKRSVFVVPWLPTDDGGFELTYIGTTDTDYDGPIDDPQCTAGGRRLPAQGHQPRRCASRSPRPTSRHLGRAAPAGEGGVERPHRRPVAPPQGHPLRPRRGHRHRRQAHDLPRDGRGHRRRARRPPRRPPPLGARDAAPRGSACAAPSARDAEAPPALTRHLADRYGSEAARGRRR